MSTFRTEKKSPSFFLKLIIIFLVSHIVLIFSLYFILPDVFLRFLFSIIAVNCYIFIFCYYYFQEKKIPLEGNERCPHHPETEVITFCKTCEHPICKYCENFQLEMRNSYQHKYRLEHKYFEQGLCVDCLLQKLSLSSKFLLTLGALFIGMGFTFIFAWLFGILNSIVYFIGGTIIPILSIYILIGGIFMNAERKKIAKEFFQSEMDIAKT